MAGTPRHSLVDPRICRRRPGLSHFRASGDVMGFVVIGLSHKTAPLELREKLASEGEKSARLLKAVLEADGVTEGMLLSTCNRVEAYLVAKGTGEAQAGVKAALTR